MSDNNSSTKTSVPDDQIAWSDQKNDASPHKPFDPADFAKTHVGLVVAGAIAIVLGLGAIIGFANWAGVRSEGNTFEAGLSANYGQGAAVLTECSKRTNAAVGASKANADFQKVVYDTIAGNGQAAHVNFDNQTSRNSLYPVWVQAYPDLAGQTDLFNKAMNIIGGCQADFRLHQGFVADNVRAFNAWRTNSLRTAVFGSSFPNENLYVDIPGNPRITGLEALHKMEQPIVDTTTSATYRTGQQDSNDPFAPATP